MRVRITGSSGRRYWYVKDIGAVFDVAPSTDETKWSVVEPDGGGYRCIDKMDCEIAVDAVVETVFPEIGAFISEIKYAS